APPAGDRAAIVVAESVPMATTAPVTTAPVTTARSGDRATAATPLTWLDLRNTEWNLPDSPVAGKADLRGGYEAFVYSDRGVYRPGETVHWRAIVRGPAGATPPAFPIAWQIRRPDLRPWKTFTGMVDADGAVGVDVPLPDDLPTGKW